MCLSLLIARYFSKTTASFLCVAFYSLPWTLFFCSLPQHQKSYRPRWSVPILLPISSQRSTPIPLAINPNWGKNRCVSECLPLVLQTEFIRTRHSFFTSARRSVYLHNNKLTDAGLPEQMFNGSDNLEILTMSSNYLQVVPRKLPSTLYRLHLKVQHQWSLLFDIAFFLFPVISFVALKPKKTQNVPTE